MNEVDSNSAFEQFVQVHQQQLIASSVPQLFWPSLFYKLKNEVITNEQVYLQSRPIQKL